MSVLLPNICLRARSSLSKSKNTFVFSRNYLLFKPNKNGALNFYNCGSVASGNDLLFRVNNHSVSALSTRKFTDNVENKNQEPKISLVARFKQMYKDYWYVLVPVHLVTSAFWLGSFYYLAKSGVDVVALLKAIGVSDRFSDPLKDSSMGYYALAYALYKVATPIRYTVTLGGTTVSIKYLKNWGYIKPMPSREELKEMYNVKKEGLQDIYQETRQELRQRKDQIIERKDHVMKDIARYKQEMREVKENELKNK